MSISKRYDRVPGFGTTRARTVRFPDGRIAGYIVRRYHIGYNPRFGATSKLDSWWFHPADGSGLELRHFSHLVLGEKGMLREVKKMIGDPDRTAMAVGK